MERVAAVADSARLPGLEHELIRSEQGTTEFQLVADLRALATDRIDLPVFLGRHGYHGPHEGQLDAVVWREDAAPVLGLLDAYRHRGGPSPEEILVARRAEHAVACARLERTLGRVRSVYARRLLRFAAHAPVWRETGRSAILRCVDVGRHAARDLGRDLAGRGVLDAPEDVFLLTVDELVAGIPAGDPRKLVEQRRRRAQEYAGVMLPQVWRGVPRRRASAPAPAADAGTGVVTGLGVSGGVAEGVVQVVHDQREADLAEGAVLVCSATDPGWASLFPLAVAVVTDVGSSMSHAAIVCRELGLPCVANTRHGTRLLRDGMRVRVNGSTGVVEILRRHSSTRGTAR
jgi:pyruvate,water dikinase